MTQLVLYYPMPGRIVVPDRLFSLLSELLAHTRDGHVELNSLELGRSFCAMPTERTSAGEDRCQHARENGRVGNSKRACETSRLAGQLCAAACWDQLAGSMSVREHYEFRAGLTKEVTQFRFSRESRTA